MRGFHWESVAEEPTFEMYRFTLIFPSLSRASAIAYAVCIRSSVSIFGPKAFSIRSAMSGDSAARPLRRAESAGHVKNLGGLGNREIKWLNNFHPDELSRMGRTHHTHR